MRLPKRLRRRTTCEHNWVPVRLTTAEAQRRIEWCPTCGALR